jgi:hypothetical protein
MAVHVGSSLCTCKAAWLSPSNLVDGQWLCWWADVCVLLSVLHAHAKQDSFLRHSCEWTAAVVVC